MTAIFVKSAEKQAGCPKALNQAQRSRIGYHQQYSNVFFYMKNT